MTRLSGVHACWVTSVVSDSVWPYGLQPARLLCPWNSTGKNTGVGSHSLFQGIFLTQWLNPGILHCRQIPYYLSHHDINNMYMYMIYSVTKEDGRAVPESCDFTWVSLIGSLFFRQCLANNPVCFCDVFWNVQARPCHLGGMNMWLSRQQFIWGCWTCEALC